MFFHRFLCQDIVQVDVTIKDQDQEKDDRERFSFVIK